MRARRLCLLVALLTAAQVVLADDKLGDLVPQQDKARFGAYVVGQALDMHIKVCHERVPSLAPLLGDLQARWRSRESGTLAEGESIFRKLAVVVAPTMTPDEYLAKELEPEHARIAGLGMVELEDSCVQVRDWFYSQLDNEPPANAATTVGDEVVGNRGTFAFSQARYAQAGKGEPLPLKAEILPKLVGDHVAFATVRGDPLRAFDAISWPTGDAAEDLARAERGARALPELRSLRVLTPCGKNIPAPTCLSFQEIVHDERGPLLANDSVVFQVGGWTYSVSARSYVPAASDDPDTLRTEVDAESSVKDAATSLAAFLDAFKPLAAPQPAASR
jgi:hypothetical protein